MDPGHDELQRALTGLGKGMVQVNLRLGRLLELAEQRDPAPSGGADPSLELLFDLLEAVEHTLAVPSTPAPRRRWWQAAPPPAPDLSGLRLARDHAVGQLRAAGLERAPESGPVDPRLHRVVEARPTADRALDATIAETHRPGWHRGGDRPAVLRVAHVSALRFQEP